VTATDRFFLDLFTVLYQLIRVRRQYTKLEKLIGRRRQAFVDGYYRRMVCSQIEQVCGGAQRLFGVATG
jgi:hypothetical protein